MHEDTAQDEMTGMNLSLSGFRVEFDGCPVVVGLDERVAAGEWLCVIGPNGAGKSSLLRGIAGLVPSSGTAQIGEQYISDCTAREAARLVAYVPQDPILPDDMSVYDYVMLGRNPYMRPFGRESSRDRDVVSRLIVDLELAVYVRRMLATLSGGERQRVVVARALAQESPVLLLDEPTSALDIGHQQRALELVDSIRRERSITVLSAMHDLTLAGLYADRLLLLHQGVAVARGGAHQVLRSETLAEFYGISARVIHEQDGTVVVVPQRMGGAS